MKIAILGAGALGCAIGSTLTEGGHETWLINRSAAHVEAMRRDGLRVDDADGSRRVKSARRRRPPKSAPSIWSSCWSSPFIPIRRCAARSISSDPTRWCCRCRTASAMKTCSPTSWAASACWRARLTSAACCAVRGISSPASAGKLTYIGELDGQITARVQAIAEAFNAAGLMTTVSDNILGTMWDKLLDQRRDRRTNWHYPSHLRAALRRTAFSRRPRSRPSPKRWRPRRPPASRFPSPTRNTRGRWRPKDFPRAFKTSMLQSLEKGSITEIDFINGAVVRWGQRLGVPTPVNATLVACIKGIERAMTDRQREGDDSMNGSKAYLEHVAIWVKDIHWHIRFFEDVLGMTMREVDGTVDEPRQYWTLGGLQFIHEAGLRESRRTARASGRDVRRPGSSARRRATLRRQRNAAGTQLDSPAGRTRRRTDSGATRLVRGAGAFDQPACGGMT